MKRKLRDCSHSRLTELGQWYEYGRTDPAGAEDQGEG
jgi:hypothetical protein